MLIPSGRGEWECRVLWVGNAHLYIIKLRSVGVILSYRSPQAVIVCVPGGQGSAIISSPDHLGHLLTGHWLNRNQLMPKNWKDSAIHATPEIDLTYILKSMHLEAGDMFFMCALEKIFGFLVYNGWTRGYLRWMQLCQSRKIVMWAVWLPLVSEVNFSCNITEV